MGKIGCVFIRIGGTEDQYLLPFVLKYKLPVFIGKIDNYNIIKRLKKRNIKISYFPKKNMNSTIKLFRRLYKRGITTLLFANYSRGIANFAKEHLKNFFLVQITHGSDDRNRIDEKNYNTLYQFTAYDLLLLDNNYWANLMKKIPASSSAKKKIKVIGNIHLALFLKNDMGRALKSKYLFYKRNGLDVNKKTVLYAPSFHDPSRKDIIGNGFFEKYGIKICKNISPQFNVIVKPHPHSLLFFKEHVKIFKNSFKKRKRFVFIRKNIDILQLILYSDVIVSDHSGICPYSLCMDKNLIVYDPTKNPIFFDFIVKHCDYAKNINDFKKFITLNMNNPSRKQNLRKKFIKESGILNPNALENAWDIITKSGNFY